MCPIGGALFDGFSRGLTARLVCHCLLVETDQGLVLIDTGFGLRDIKSPYSRLSPFFIHFNGIQFDRKYTALDQIERLGFSASDVRHIVLTHLDFDHAGGLEDFPEATVHVMQSEAEAVQDRHGFIARRRYRPEQWDEVKHWKYYSAGANLGSASRQYVSLTDCHRRFSSFRLLVTRGVMLVSPSRHQRVGC
jgi:glyoxylase-like metal-dependent hydrolase (beta-lactamase superfamily II)